MCNREAKCQAKWSALNMILPGAKSMEHVNQAFSLEED